MPAQRVDIGLGEPVGHSALVKQIADLHTVIHIQRHGGDIRAVQFIVDHTGANGVAIQTDEQVEQRSPVADHDLLITFQGA